MKYRDFKNKKIQENISDVGSKISNKIEENITGNDSQLSIQSEGNITVNDSQSSIQSEGNIPVNDSQLSIQPEEKSSSLPLPPPLKIKKKIKVSVSDNVDIEDLKQKHCDDIEQLVIDKYQGIKTFYDDLNNPDNIVPNKEELRSSLNSLLMAEEKVKFTIMVDQYDQKICQLKKIIDSLISIVDILLHFND